MIIVRTRPSVNYAKDWLDQFFLIPGQVWSGKGYHLWMSSLWGTQKTFSCALGHFQHGEERTNKRTTRWSQCKPALKQWEGSLLQYFFLSNCFFQDVLRRLRGDTLQSREGRKSIADSSMNISLFQMCLEFLKSKVKNIKTWRIFAIKLSN